MLTGIILLEKLCTSSNSSRLNIVFDFLQYFVDKSIHFFTRNGKIQFGHFLKNDAIEIGNDQIELYFIG